MSQISKALPLYFGSILIWGTTWFSIKLQLGDVDPQVSVAYRFALASLILFGWAFFRKLNLKFNRKDHLTFFLQGIFLFSLNYLLMYFATGHLKSCIVAIIFSFVIFFNMVNAYLVFKTPIEVSSVIGGLLAIGGLSLIYMPEIKHIKLGLDAFEGLFLGLGAAFSASLGNIISAYNSSRKLGVTESNTWAMLYGTLFSFVIIFCLGIPVTFSFTTQYVFSLLHLAVFGSVFAFGLYLNLIAKVGPEKGAYALVGAPVVAILVSSVFEGFEWTIEAILGILFVVCGNILALSQKIVKIKKPF